MIRPGLALFSAAHTRVLRVMRRGLILPILFLLPCFAHQAQAQAVSPAVVQYSGATEGSFELSNDTLTALIATIDTRSFSIDREGDGIFRPLDASIHLELSQTSVRVPPHQRRTVYYKATADRYPAWFSIYTTFHGLPKRSGLNVQLSLPHTVYLLDRRAPAQEDLRFTALRVNGNQVEGVLHNRGPGVVRLRELTVHRGREKSVLGGFPLLPGGDRAFSLDLPRGSAPALVRAQLDKVSLEQAVP